MLSIRKDHERFIFLFLFFLHNAVYENSLISKAILQRVASASVTIDTRLISSIGKGVLVFAAVAPDDTQKEVESMAAKVLKLKLWPDETGGTVYQTTPCRFVVLKC